MTSPASPAQPISDERLDWHILTLEATPAKARSIWQNEQLQFYRELQHLRQQSAEIARLREALQDIVDERRTDEDGIYYRLACTADMVEHAARALTETPK